MTQDGISVKKEDVPDASIAQDFDVFMAQMESDTGFFPRKRKHSVVSISEVDFDIELKKPINLEPKLEPNSTEPNSTGTDPLSMPSSRASPRTSPFESIGQSETSVSTEEHGEDTEKVAVDTTPDWEKPDMHTVGVLKRSMASGSRLIGTFTALKTTYLKLCKEFNFLLGKFNENERIKIELIHENNELRKLLYETIKEKELDRKKYKTELLAKTKSSATIA